MNKEHPITMKRLEILQILITPKTSRIFAALASGIVIGLVIIMIISLVVIDPVPRLIAGIVITGLITIYQFRSMTEKNRQRAKDLGKVMNEMKEIQVTRITTNRIKPGKSFRVASGKSSVIIPEKRWVKIEPLLQENLQNLGIKKFSIGKDV